MAAEPRTRLAVDEIAGARPHAPLVVIVHGAGDRASSFRRVVKHLSEFRVIVYDRRGYARSVHAVPPAVSIKDHARDLLEIIGDRRATVVGDSFGSSIALVAAATAPASVASAGLWEPPTPWAEWWPSWARRMVSKITAAGDPAEVGERAFKRVAGEDRWERLGEDERALRRAEGAAFITDSQSELIQPFVYEAVKAPVVVGYGTESWPHMSAAAERLAAELGGEVFIIDGAGHVAHATHAEGFARFIARAVALGSPDGRR